MTARSPRMFGRREERWARLRDHCTAPDMGGPEPETLTWNFRWPGSQHNHIFGVKNLDNKEVLISDSGISFFIELY